MSIKRPLGAAAALLALMLAGGAAAQGLSKHSKSGLLRADGESGSEWQEVPTTLPTAAPSERLVPVKVVGSDLRFAVDAPTVRIDPDGVVRYVVVARSASGAFNAMYEGIRCLTAEVKVYARYSPGSGWRETRMDWQPLQSSFGQRHSMAIARGGACLDNDTPRSVPDLLRELR